MPHRFAKRHLLFGAALLAAAGGLLLWRVPGVAPGASQVKPGPRRPIARQVETGVREVYPYSVVPGGVFNPLEAIAAAEGDAVVARHYDGVALAALRPVVLAQPRQAHVSYRKGGKIYWTRQPVTIRAGEAILTDGNEKIRARCGNRISDVAREPVAAAEPTADITTETSGPDVAIVATPEELADRYGIPNPGRRALVASFGRLEPEQETSWWPPIPGFVGVLLPGGGGGQSGGAGGGNGTGAAGVSAGGTG